MKKSIIYFISLFVVLATISTAKNSFLIMPNHVEGEHFIANLPSGQIYLSDDGISFVAVKQVPNSDESVSNKTPNQYELHRINLKYKNANKPIVSTSDVTSDSEYIIYNKKSVPLFRTNEVYYSNVYNRIDLKAYFTLDGEFEFDFIVHPNANPDDIQLIVEHQKSIKLNEIGKIKLQFEFDELLIDSPFSYQIGTNSQFEIASSFSVQNNIISFDVSEYDKTKQLVIDPITRFMGSYFGGTGNEVANDITEDSQGNYYITGYTQSPFNIAHNGYQLVLGGLEDAYLAKFDKDDNRVWSTYFGGTNYESANGLTIDLQGNIIIVGETRSSSNISTQTAHQQTYGGGGSDGFIAKFTPNGLLQWATYYGGDQLDLIKKVVTDNSDNIYVVGYTASDNNIFANGHQFGRNGMTDALVVKFNSLGTRIWGTYYGGSSEEKGNDITIDPSKNIYIIGTTSSTDNINYLGSNTTLSGSSDAFVTSFKDDGNIIWSTYYGGSLYDEGNAIFSDGQYLYFGGSTLSNNGIAFNGYQNSLGGSSDGFLVKFDFLQNGFWGTYFGGSGNDFLYDIYSTGTGIYTTGSTQSTNNVALLGWQQGYGGGGSDGYLTKYLPIGIVEWSTYYGGTNTDVLEGISNSNKLLISGHTNSDNNIGQDGFQNNYTGQLDAIFAEMSESELTLILSEDKYCSGKEYDVNIDFLNLTFENTNEFIVELSDEQGSFGNPDVVGRKTTNAKTTITIMLPELTEYSKNYKLRLKSTSPQYNGNTSLDSITIFPEPRIDNSSAPLCVTENMIFSTYDIPDVTYIWEFENGMKTDSSQYSNKVHWDQAGEYKVTLISENPVCKDTATNTVKVFDLPVAEFEGDTMVCESSMIAYNTTNKADIKYTWNTEGGTVISASEEGEAIVNWTQSGDGKVILIARDTVTNCETATEKSIRIIDTPVAIITGTDTTCRECTEILTTDATSISEWKIQFGTIINESNTQLTFKPLSNADSVIVTLIKINEPSNCSDTTTKTIYLTNTLQANISGKKQVCESEEYEYSTSSDPTLTNSWTITGGDEVSKTDNTITIKWSQVGQGSLKLVQKSKENSYIDSTILDVTIQTKPVSFDHNIPSEVCMGDTVPIKFILMDKETIVIKIDGTIVENESLYQAVSAGVKIVDFEISNEFGCALKGKYEMIVKDKPESASINIDGTEINSDKNGTHRWYINGVLIANINTTKLIVSEDGIYTCRYLLDGCWSEESNKINYSTSSVEDFTRLGIKIYPNPADDILQLNTDILIDEFELVDILGNKIIGASNIFSTEYDISELNAGIYFVKIVVNDKLLTKKIIVK